MDGNEKNEFVPVAVSINFKGGTNIYFFLKLTKKLFMQKREIIFVAPVAAEVIFEGAQKLQSIIVLRHHW